MKGTCCLELELILYIYFFTVVTFDYVDYIFELQFLFLFIMNVVLGVSRLHAWRAPQM